MFCTQPFNRIEIYENGDVYNCCPEFINNYKIGNIFKTPFDEIWNGEKVKNIRRHLLNGDFSLCNNICSRKYHNENKDKYTSETVFDYPEDISISSDNSCNVKCKICRDENWHITFDKNSLDKEIEEIWLPVLKNAKIVRFGCSGEPFASYKETLLIQKIAQRYPDIKFHIHTNGILGNKEKLESLNIFNRIDKITVSMHSASLWTYNKIVRGGQYFKVLKNLKLYSEMKKSGLLNELRMIFVVYSENYKEMPGFVKLAKKYNASAEFWALRKSNTALCKNFEKYSIMNPEHKKHKELVNILKKPVFDEKNAILYPELSSLRKQNMKELI